MYTLIRGVGGDVPIYIISAEVAVKVLASVKSPGAGLQSSAGLVQRISLCSCKRATWRGRSELRGVLCPPQGGTWVPRPGFDSEPRPSVP